MVAKLVLALVAFVLVVLGATAAAFWYFDRQAERDHERDLQRMEQTDRLVEVAEREAAGDSGRRDEEKASDRE